MQENINLKPFTTLKTNCIARYFMPITTTYQLLNLIETPLWDECKHWILWWGANTLFCAEVFDGIVVKMEIPWFKILSEDETSLKVQVWAGESWNKFVYWAAERGLGGVENLIDIPGTVGTSAVSNIWAYGQEASSSISQVIGVNLETKTIQKLTKEECQFAYRESIFKHELQDQFIITHIIFELKKVNDDYQFATEYADIQKVLSEKKSDFDQLSPFEKLREISQIISNIRASKLPDYHTIWTAGSYRKNPEIWLPEREELSTQFPELKAYLTEQETMKLSAGQLIELCWWKGKEENWVKMYEKHALILVNEGESWSAVLDYVRKVEESVLAKFWIHLQPEVRYCY